MPCGSKKRKAARKKKETEGNNESSVEEESSSRLESIDEKTIMLPAANDGLHSSEENSSIGLPTDHAISMVEEIDDELDTTNDHGEVSNSNKENFVHDADIAVIEKNSDLVPDEHVEAGQGLSFVDSRVAVVDEKFQTIPVQQNMLSSHISDQLEELKKMVIEGLCDADKTRTTLQELLTKIQQIEQ
ncbi:hypothetical protein F511_07922 [Dorcoceras hygrometricum]|uniref:Uncharacterized protein n=1 Tax=Dorcoceras hygrometricum TaxID=472368 RepID=A0A2Z7CH87_9LAMI|nr:hypothetical protein F511_07922 [Dorcoceras hygrometricum]